MFDIGFSELLFLAVVGLLVLGPERLPEAAKTLGLVISRLRRSFESVRSEISRELEAEEIRQRLAKEREKMGLDDLRESFEQAGRQLNETIQPAPGRTVDTPASDAGVADQGTAGQQPGARTDSIQESTDDDEKRPA